MIPLHVTWECGAERRMIVVDHVRYALHFAPFAETEGDPLLGGSDFLSVVRLVEFAKVHTAETCSHRHIVSTSDVSLIFYEFVVGQLLGAGVYFFQQLTEGSPPRKPMKRLCKRQFRI